MGNRNTSPITVVSLCLCLGIVSADVFAAERWTTGIVIPANRYFIWSGNKALGVDSNGLPHIAYGYDQLYHAYYNGVQWLHDTVDTGFRLGNPYLAVDSASRTHIAYYLVTPPDSHGVKYATNASGTWQASYVEVNDEHVYYDTAPVLAVDSARKAHMLFWKVSATQSSLIYATNASGSWTNQHVMDTNSDGRVVVKDYDIAIDSSNNIHVAYLTIDTWASSCSLVYARRYAGNWESQSVCAPTSPYSVAIAVGSNNTVHIAYQDSILAPPYDVLMYVSGSWNNWSEPQYICQCDWWIQEIDLALAIGNVPNIVFYDCPYDLYRLRRAYRSGQNWSLETCADGLEYSTFGLASLAFSPTGVPTISYFHKPYMVSSTKPGAFWYADYADYAGLLDEYCYLAVDAKSKSHVLYADNERKDLLYATNKSGSWVTSNICKFSHSLADADLALDAQGFAHILINDKTSLKYMTNQSGSWSTYIISTVGRDYDRTGCHPSISIGPDRKVHIAFTEYDCYPYSCSVGLCFATTAYLLYVTNTSGDWITYALASHDNARGNISLNPDLAVDSTGKVHISYSYSEMYTDLLGHVIKIDELRYFTNLSGNWVDSLLAEDVPYAAPSIALDPNNKPHISFHNGDANSIAHFTNASGSWQSENVFIGQPDYHTSIAVSPTGTVSISFYDWQSSSVKHAYGTYGNWNTMTVDSNLTVGPTSLGVDPSGGLYLCYTTPVRELANERCLKYATNTFPWAGISVYPTSLSFAVTQGGQQTKTVTVASVGTQVLTVYSAIITGANASQFSRTASLPVMLPPNGNTTVSVKYQPTSTGVHSATLVIDSNDEEQPTVQVPLSGVCLPVLNPDLTVSTQPHWKGFGDVNVGEISEPVGVTISNTGSMSLNIDQVYLSDANNFVLQYTGSCPFPPCHYCGAPPFTLDPHEYCGVLVYFRPQRTGSLTTILKVHAAFPPQAASASIALSGTGIPGPQPQISVQPHNYDFGQVLIQHSSDPLTLAINNTGDANLIVNKWWLSDKTHYTIDVKGGPNPIGGKIPVTIPPRQNRTMNLTFSSPTIGTYNATLKIYSNDPNHPTSTVNLAASAFHWNVCDLNFDTVINFEDFAIIAQQWLSPPGQPSADLKPPPDGIVDLYDLDYCLESWLGSLSP